MPRFIHLILVALLALAVMQPVAADEFEQPTEPTFREEPNSFLCSGGDPMKVQNNQYPTAWSTEAPTRSVQSGAGCGSADPSFVVNTSPHGGPWDFSAVGEYTGNLKNITIELHLLGTGAWMEASGTANLQLWLTIDGQDIIPARTIVDNVPFVTSSAGTSKKLEFTIAGLPVKLAQELGDGTKRREVTVTVGCIYINDVAYAWAWGASEVPAGMTFNDTTPAGFAIWA